MRITFIGATQTVTGSKYLLESENKKILVDCGLFQGTRDLRLRNWEDLPIPATSIDAVLLTHAHLDHCGYIPKLIKDGFTGPIYCSEATYDLCKIILPDSGHIQEDDAEAANLHGYSKHSPALPLYTKKEAEKSLESFKTIPFGQPHYITDSLHFTLHRAGHILGASFIRLQDSHSSILFSGDIGRLQDPVIKPPAHIQDADYIVVESTYGDRLHDRNNPTDDLENIILRTVTRGGTVVIPSFAVGRAQTLLYHLYLLKLEKRIPDIPVYLDSPMAINATDLLVQHMKDHILSPDKCQDVCSVAKYTRTAEESKSINLNTMPKIIISASGMATGGRVLYHLKNYLGDDRNTIILAGFQAAGTRGDRLARGEKEIRIHGKTWPVRAEIIKFDNMSAHADYQEILDWLGRVTKSPSCVFVTHGESDAAISLGKKIKDRFGWDVVIPEYLHQETL